MSVDIFSCLNAQLMVLAFCNVCCCVNGCEKPRQSYFVVVACVLALSFVLLGSLTRRLGAPKAL